MFPILSTFLPTEQGRINLQFQLSNSSFIQEDEPILVDVEELPKQSSDISTPTSVSSQLLPQTSMSPEYPLTTYIKSFSHDSDSTSLTQTSLDTNTTVDYITSDGAGNMDEDDQEEEEEFVEVTGFFPSHNVFMEQLAFGGKLTLDAVKIDCGNFFQDS